MTCPVCATRLDRPTTHHVLLCRGCTRLWYATPTADGDLVEHDLSAAAHEAMRLYWASADAYARFARLYESALHACGG